MAIDSIVVSTDGGNGLSITLHASDGIVTAKDIDPEAIENAVQMRLESVVASIVEQFGKLDDTRKSSALQAMSDFAASAISKTTP